MFLHVVPYELSVLHDDYVVQGGFKYVQIIDFMNIILDKDICTDFNLASNKEWLESNKLGAYAMSTVYGLNNQRYHGLYVIPTNDEDDKIIILSKFEESLFIENRVYELSTNQFKGGLHPEGFRYIQRFTMDPFPRFLFEVEDKRIEKTHSLVLAKR